MRRQDGGRGTMPTRPPASPIRRPARFLLTARHHRRPTLLPPRHTSTACWRTALRHSDVLTMTSWMGLTRSRTVDCLPRQRFPSQEVIHRSRRLRARHRGCSQRAGPVRSQRVVWRGVHRMWCGDRRRTRLPRLNASCRPSPNLTPGRMRRDPGFVDSYSSL